MKDDEPAAPDVRALLTLHATRIRLGQSHSVGFCRVTAFQPRFERHPAVRSAIQHGRVDVMKGDEPAAADFVGLRHSKRKHLEGGVGLCRFSLADLLGRSSQPRFERHPAARSAIQHGRVDVMKDDEPAAPDVRALLRLHAVRISMEVSIFAGSAKADCLDPLAPARGSAFFANSVVSSTPPYHAFVFRANLRLA